MSVKWPKPFSGLWAPFVPERTQGRRAKPVFWTPQVIHNGYPLRTKGQFVLGELSYPCAGLHLSGRRDNAEKGDKCHLKWDSGPSHPTPASLLSCILPPTPAWPAHKALPGDKAMGFSMAHSVPVKVWGKGGRSGCPSVSTVWPCLKPRPEQRAPEDGLHNEGTATRSPAPAAAPHSQPASRCALKRWAVQFPCWKIPRDHRR